MMLYLLPIRKCRESDDSMQDVLLPPHFSADMCCHFELHLATGQVYANILVHFACNFLDKFKVMVLFCFSLETKMSSQSVMIALCSWKGEADMRKQKKGIMKKGHGESFER